MIYIKPDLLNLLRYQAWKSIATSRRIWHWNLSRKTLDKQLSCLSVFCSCTLVGKEEANDRICSSLLSHLSIWKFGACPASLLVCFPSGGRVRSRSCHFVACLLYLRTKWRCGDGGELLYSLLPIFFFPPFPNPLPPIYWHCGIKFMVDD